jgi:Zn-dependent peptidase ImmA (M78 family)
VSVTEDNELFKFAQEHISDPEWIYNDEIDIVKLSVKHFKVKVFLEVLWFKNKGNKGYIKHDGGNNFSIHVNMFLSLKEQFFTVAHELAHFVFDKDEIVRR